MNEISYTCSHCGKQASFKPEEEKQLLIEMKVRRPQTYYVYCPHCGSENVVTIKPE